MSIKCTKCGIENTDDSQFCKKCGKKLLMNQPPPPPPPDEKTESVLEPVEEVQFDTEEKPVKKKKKGIKKSEVLDEIVLDPLEKEESRKISQTYIKTSDEFDLYISKDEQSVKQVQKKYFKPEKIMKKKEKDTKSVVHPVEEIVIVDEKNSEVKIKNKDKRIKSDAFNAYKKNESVLKPVEEVKIDKKDDEFTTEIVTEKPHLEVTKPLKVIKKNKQNELPDDIKVPDYLEGKTKVKKTIIFLSILLSIILLIIAGFLFGPRIIEELTTEHVVINEIDVPSGMVLIPGGIYRIGSYKAVFNDEVPNFKVDVDSFFMKITPVTVSEFAVFINQTGYITRAEMDSTIGFWTDTTGYQHDGGFWKYPRGKEGPEALKELSDHPVTQITWFDAAVYCNWMSVKEGLEEQYDTLTWTCSYTEGYRLPTEFEWECAAKGLSMSTYPWGEMSPKADTANALANHAGYERVGDYMEDQLSGDFSKIFDHMVLDGYAFTSPVNAFPPNSFGLHDMAGNVWEWCNNYYELYHPETFDNPKGPEIGEYRTMRGGSFGHDYRYLRCASRGKNVSGTAVEVIGFRVMRPLPLTDEQDSLLNI